MANGAGRIFDVFKNTAENTNNIGNQYVVLEVVSTNPLQFKLGDKLIITEEFIVLSSLVDINLLTIGSKVQAFVFNNNQLFYILNNRSFTQVIDNLTSEATDKALSANQGRILKGLIDNLFTSIADEYSSSRPYYAGEYCIHENILYRCIQNSQGFEEWTPAHWTAVTVGDEIKNRVKKAGDTMTGDLTMNNSVIKIAKGYNRGINNTDGLPIIRDHGNSNVTVDATGDTLFLGYQNTLGINILNGKIKIEANGDIKAPIFTTTSTVSNYFTTVNANKVIRFGKIVHVVFRGYVNTAIPNNTTFLTVPYKSAIGSIESGLVGGYGGQYNIETPFWAYLNESGGIRCGGVPAGKWVHINMTYITSD